MACVSLYLQKTFLFLSLLLPFASIVAEEALSHMAINSTNGAHATSAQKHNVIQQKKRRLSYPIYTWFSLHVNNHFARVKVDAETKLTSDQRVVKELLHALYHIEQCSTPGQGQYIALLERLRSAYDKAAHDGHEAYVDKEVHESARCALLLKISATLSNKVRKVILDILYTLDEQLAYWQDQENHSTRYFFHKSPHKWFIGKEQKDEIRSNICMLEKAQEVHYRFLGALTSHLHTFNINASNNEQYQWITNLLAITSELLGQDTMHHEEGIDRFDVIAECMQQNFGTVFSHKKQVMSNLSEAKKPNHFVRNWICYTALLGGVLCVRNYWNNNPEVVDAWIGEDAREKYKESFVNSLKQYVVDPVKDMWNIVFNNEVPEKPDTTSTFDQSFDKKIDQKIEVLDEKRKSLTQKRKKVTSYAKKAKKRAEVAYEQIEQFCKKAKQLPEEDKGHMSSEQATAILDAIKSDDTTPFQEYISNLPGLSLNRVGWTSMILKLPLIDPVWLLLQRVAFKDVQDILVDLNKSGVDIDEIAIELKDVLIEGRKGIMEGRKGIAYMVDQLYDLIKKNGLSTKFTALIPVFAAAWGLQKTGGKLYTWFTKRDYAAIRQALAHVYTILIESAHNFDDTDYGKLIYLLHNLKQTAKRHITRKNNMHREFEADILKLESADDFTPAEKRLIIDNMRAHYPFLMCTQ